MRYLSTLAVHGLFGLFLLPVASLAQADTLSTNADRVMVTKEVFTIVEEMPAFPGGEQELFKFLGQTLRYPQQAIDANISGVVYVTFVVDVDGSITDTRILRGIGGGCDEEALRVVNAMPHWTPGRQKGKNVKVQYNLPIRYTIRDDAKEERKVKVYRADELSLLPRFPGGPSALENHLTENIVIGKKARKVKGEVRVQFEVDREGAVKDVKVIGPLHPELDAEVVRVIGSMPAWQPGLSGRSIVRSTTELNVRFPRP